MSTYERKTSGSSSKGSSSRSSSKRDPSREYWVSESTQGSDSTERFFATGKSERSGDSMSRTLKQWDDKWAQASRRH